MANVKEQLVTAKMLNDAGWLDTAERKWPGGSKTWGEITGNPNVLMTINGFFKLPFAIFTQHADGTVTSHANIASLKNYKWKSDITDFDRLLRWKDFEKDDFGSTGGDPDTTLHRNVTEHFGFYGWNVTNLEKSSDGTYSADVQIVMTPPDGETTAAREDYHWIHQRNFKIATSASQPTALGLITFSGSFTKGSTGYMYSTAIHMTMYGVSGINHKTLENGSDFIMQSCWYYETV